jgi:hypothetical protein
MNDTPVGKKASFTVDGYKYLGQITEENFSNVETYVTLSQKPSTLS